MHDCQEGVCPVKMSPKSFRFISPTLSVKILYKAFGKGELIYISKMEKGR